MNKTLKKYLKVLLFTVPPILTIASAADYALYISGGQKVSIALSILGNLWELLLILAGFCMGVLIEAKRVNKW